MERTLLQLATKELSQHESQALVALLSGRGLPTITKVANYGDRNHYGHGVCQQCYYSRYDFYDNKHHHCTGTQLLLRQTLQFKHRCRNDHHHQHLSATTTSL